jgi:hypothetical protein
MYPRSISTLAVGVIDFGMTLLRTFHRYTSAVAPRRISKRFFAAAASETEQVLRGALSNYCKAVIQPKVSDMDQRGVMDPSIVKSLFDQVRDSTTDLFA